MSNLRNCLFTWSVLLLIHMVWVRRTHGDAEIPALIIFGDSTMDAGNNNYLETIIKADFAPYGRDFVDHKATGRFCNGQLITDFIATKLDLPFPLAYLDPAAEGSILVQGINFASAASGYYDGTAELFNVIGFQQQIEWFKIYQSKLFKLVGASQASDIIGRAAYVISTGSNDYVNNYYVNLAAQERYTKLEYKALIASLARHYFQELYDLGARRMVVISMPPLGCLPSQISLYNGGTTCVKFANEDAAAVNVDLYNVVHDLNFTLTGVKMVWLDAYTALEQAFYDPSSLGLKYARRGCCGTGLLEVGITCNPDTPDICSNADEYLFWDSFHPSEHVNQQLADTYYNIARAQLVP